MAAHTFICPVCQIPLPSGATTCPDCGENLSALLHLDAKPKIAYNTGLGLARKGQIDQALGVLLQAMEADPADPAMPVVLGKLYAQQGRNADARAAWTRALELNPAQPEAKACLQRLDTLESEAQQAGEMRAQEQATTLQRQNALGQRRRMLQFLGTFLCGVVFLLLAQFLWDRVASPNISQPTQQAAVPVQPSPTLLPASPTAVPSVTPVPTPVPSPTAIAAVLCQPAVCPSQPTATPAPIPQNLEPDVQRALQAMPDLASLTIKVQQVGTVVRLVGVVPNLTVLYQVASTAAGVPGVTAVDFRELTLMHSYVLQAGDSLWSVTEKFYGDGRLWPQLVKANGLHMPYTIHPGQVIVLPDQAEFK